MSPRLILLLFQCFFGQAEGTGREFCELVNAFVLFYVLCKTFSSNKTNTFPQHQSCLLNPRRPELLLLPARQKGSSGHTETSHFTRPDALCCASLTSEINDSSCGPAVSGAGPSEVLSLKNSNKTGANKLKKRAPESTGCSNIPRSAQQKHTEHLDVQWLQALAQNSGDLVAVL